MRICRPQVGRKLLAYRLDRPHVCTNICTPWNRGYLTKAVKQLREPQLSSVLCPLSREIVTVLIWQEEFPYIGTGDLR